MITEEYCTRTVVARFHFIPANLFYFSIIVINIFIKRVVSLSRSRTRRFQIQGPNGLDQIEAELCVSA